jgi:hypothetical protein
MPVKNVMSLTINVIDRPTKIMRLAAKIVNDMGNNMKAVPSSIGPALKATPSVNKRM